MKGIKLIPLFLLSLLLLAGCWDWNPFNPEPKVLTVTYTKTLAGYVLSTSEASSRALTADDVEYEAADADKGRVTTDPAQLNGKVAFLNTVSGNITPLGNQPTTISIKAKAKSTGATGTVSIPISIIDFASDQGKSWQVVSYNGTALPQPFPFTIFGDISAVPASAPAINGGSFYTEIDLTTTAIGADVSILNQNNSGFIVGLGQYGSSPWFALDNKIYVDNLTYNSPVNTVGASADITVLQTPATSGVVGNYDWHNIFAIEFTSATEFIMVLPNPQNPSQPDTMVCQAL